jgi:tRNA synthetases class I (I, L, M and V)/Protein of unknown function (DUF835)/Anticodon-binding domain of tRNA ligase
MVPIPERPDPKAIELDARALWKRERIPPPSGVLGPAEGPAVHELEGSFAPQESGMLVVQRAVAADIDARALALSGRRVTGVLRREDSGPPTTETLLGPLLTSLGVWVGGEEGRGFTGTPRPEAVQAVAGRLAHAGAIAVRDVALRVCPACALARDPERIVYREENGATLLVRFPLGSLDPPVSALVWSDSAWRLLGASALLVHPDLPYVIARYRREGREERIFTSKSSLDRIRRWLRDAEIEVLEEHPGKHWEGTPYVHPLRNEFPLGGGLEPPASTMISATEVTDTGTGIVPLVPGHGGTDAVIAERLGVPGWPLLTPKGRFDITLVHKYSGLELDSGDEFVGRDLSEMGAIFAQLLVRRGVPHCARCGTRLIWAPGRAWCLEPSRLPAATLALYRSILPRDRPIERLEVVPWPVSEPLRSEDPQAVSLLECTSCDRLEAPGAGGDRCPCGGHRKLVRRRLLPAFEAAAAEWGRLDPFPPADAVRLYVNERRRAPSVVHQLAAMSGIGGVVGDVRLVVLPTVPEVDLPGLIAQYGADAVRAALARAQGSEGRTGTFTERCVQERQRLDRLFATTRAVVARIDPTALATYGQPVATVLGELDPEDRALLARFERMRIQALADFDRGMPFEAHRRLFRFLDNDLATHRAWSEERMRGAGPSPPKRAALRTQVHVLLQSAILLAPIAPHSAETIHGVLAPRRASVFEETVPGVDRALLDDERAKAWDRWTSVVRALERHRRTIGVAPSAVLPTVVLVVPSDATADEFRAEASILERLAHVTHLEIGSPASPWSGRRRQLRPVESEIQRVYSSRAAQIIHLLRRTSERKVLDPGGQGFSLMVNGQPTQILPSMLDWVETVPERFVPAPWANGEMYVESPAGPTSAAARPPPLSADAFRLVERVGHRLRESHLANPGSEVALVVASGRLGAELTAVAAGVAAYLGIRDLRVVPTERELPPGQRERGRERGGAPWMFHLSGLAAPSAPAKHRPSRGRGERVRPAFAPQAIAPKVPNLAEDDQVAHHTAIRTLGDELDQILGRPLIGPAKVQVAWEAGLRSVDDFRLADWPTLVALPGFGVPVASLLVEKFGGTVPPPPPRIRRSAGGSRPGNGGGVAPVDSVHWTETALHEPPPSTAPSVPAPRSVAAAISPGAPPLPVRGPPPSATPPPPPAPTPRAPPVEVAPPRTEPATPEVDLDRTPGSPIEPPTGEPPVAPDPTPPPVVNGTRPGPDFPSPLTGTTDALSEPSPGVEEPDTTGTLDERPAVEAPGPSSEVPLSEGPELALRELPTEPDRGPVAEPVLPLVPELPALEAPPTEDALPPPPEELALPPAEDPPLPPSPSSADEPAGTTSPAFADSGELEIREEVPGPAEGTVPDGPLTLTSTEGSGTDPPDVGPDLSDGAPALPPAVEGSPSAPIGPEPDPTGGPSGGAVDSVEVLSAPEPATSVPSPVVPPPPAPIALAGPMLRTAPPLTLPPEPVLAPAVATPVGGVELDVGPSYLPSLERFLDATAAGHLGICVVRDSPERVRAYAGSRPVEIRWLTNIGRGATLKPTDLEGFSAFLAHAITSGRATVFFLEGIEYLVRLHGLDRVVAELASFDRLARSQSARVWVSLNPKLLSPSELDRFVTEFGPRGAAP